MPTTGTSGATQIDLATILDHAFRRCRLNSSVQTPELVAATLENLQFLLWELANIGLNLWCIEKVIQGLYLYQEAYPTPIGTVDVLDTFLRHSSRAGGILTSSDGSDVLALEDADILTFSTQGVTGGHWLYTFDSATAVRTVGILHRGATARSLVFEFSQDNVTWSTEKTIGQVSYTDGTWFWYDIEPSHAGLYFRIRDTLTNAPLTAYELFIAAAVQTEIAVARMNRDDWTALPTKFSNGRPLQFWLDRATPQPTIRVWPSPGSVSLFDQLVYWRHRQVQDVGTDLTFTIETPPRWSEAIISGLAYKVAMETPQVDPQLIGVLGQIAEKALGWAEGEEVDRSVMTLRPVLRHYTRA